jgi:hypothetical protein
MEELMDESFVCAPEESSQDYRERAQVATDSADHARSAEVAESYLRLAECWKKLAAAVDASALAESRSAA